MVAALVGSQRHKNNQIDLMVDKASSAASKGTIMCEIIKVCIHCKNIIHVNFNFSKIAGNS